MELQELTTEELMNIEGGSVGNLFYAVFCAAFKTFHFADDLSNSLRDNPDFGNAMIYK